MAHFKLTLLNCNIFYCETCFIVSCASHLQIFRHIYYMVFFGVTIVSSGGKCPLSQATLIPTTSENDVLTTFVLCYTLYL